MFWINFSKASDSEPFFYNSTISNRNFRTCQLSKKSFTTDHIWSELDSHKKNILMNGLLAENHFSTLLSRKNATSSVMRFLKNHDIEKKEKKQFLNQDFQKRNRFWNRFSTTRQTLNQEVQNMSDFLSTLNNSSFLESEILQHVKFWNIFFTTRQILIRNFRNATDFYVKLVLKKEIFLDNLFANNLSKHVKIQANLKQLVSFWIRTFAACQF